MFNVSDIDAVNSYATKANAVAAVEKKMGKQNEGARHFNVLVVCNSAGRFVPIICNIDKEVFHHFIHCGFYIIN